MIDPIRFFIHTIHNVSVIRQKDKNRKQKTKITRGNKKTKLAKSSENQKFLPPDTHTYMWISGGKKCFVFRKNWRALFCCYLCFYEYDIHNKKLKNIKKRKITYT